MAVCTSGLKVLTVLTRANETNGYSDYDAVAFIVTTMEKKAVFYGGAGSARWLNATQLSERHDVSKNDTCPYYHEGLGMTNAYVKCWRK